MSRRLGCIATIAVVVGNCGPGFEFGPDQIVVSDPHGFVREARALVEKQAGATAGDHQWLDEKHLPPALRIQKIALPRLALSVASVCEAYIASDHLDLVLLRHTDGHGGARVWAANGRPHRDMPTQYTDIHFFSYDKERPESQENIP